MNMKPFITIGQQLDLLESRGMLIEDRVVAAHALETIGYYRLSGYSYPFRRSLTHVKDRDQAFAEDTHFTDVLSLYAFDVRLRSTVFAQLACIEIALRTWIGNEVGKIDPAMHLDVMKLGPVAQQVDKRTGKTRYETWKEEYDRKLSTSNEDFAKHHRQSCGGELPIWVAVQLLDWGALQTLFSMLPRDVQDAIVASVGVTAREMKSWLNALRVLRNISAHHSRLFNRVFPSKPLLPKAVEVSEVIGNSGPNNRVFYLLSLTQYFLDRFKIGDKTALPSVLADFPIVPQINILSMGAPMNWKSLGLWGS